MQSNFSSTKKICELAQNILILLGKVEKVSKPSNLSLKNKEEIKSKLIKSKHENKSDEDYYKDNYNNNNDNDNENDNNLFESNANQNHTVDDIFEIPTQNTDINSILDLTSEQNNTNTTIDILGISTNLNNLNETETKPKKNFAFLNKQGNNTNSEVVNKTNNNDNLNSLNNLFSSINLGKNYIIIIFLIIFTLNSNTIHYIYSYFR